MKTVSKKLFVVILLFGLISCESLYDDSDFDSLRFDKSINDVSMLKSKEIKNMAIGEVDIKWKGKDKGSENGNRPDDLLANFKFSAHEGYGDKMAKGEITFTLLTVDSVLHRQIGASVFQVKIDVDLNKAWFIAEVISDTKGCSGDGSGGHSSDCSHDDSHDDSGCSHDDDSSHDDGGCSHDDTSHDDGSTHDDSSHDGGCSHDDGSTHDDTSHDDGGCSHDDDDSSHDDGGCSHDDDDSSHDDGGCSDGSTDHGGNPGGISGPGGKAITGKNCRLGQLIVVKVHDVGTPGINGDGITWKWFLSEAEFVPTIENIDEWPHLCKKTIIGGNLVVR